jgi:tubulin-specific chaperone C
LNLEIEEELKNFDIKFESEKLNKEELKQNLEEINETIKDLKDDYKNNASFLVGYDKQNYMNLIEELTKTLESKKEKLNPKKKFAFSNKSTVVKETITQTDNIPGSNQITPTNFKNESNEFLLCEKSNLEKLIINKEEIGEKNNLIIDNIKNSDIYILYSFKALYIKNVSNCKIFIGSVAGGSHITNCTDSKIYLATHQLRIHQTHNTHFFIISTSNPIIEDCSGLIFSPLNVSYQNFLENLGVNINLLKLLFLDG